MKPEKLSSTSNDFLINLKKNLNNTLLLQNR